MCGARFESSTPFLRRSLPRSLSPQWPPSQNAARAKFQEILKEHGMLAALVTLIRDYQKSAQDLEEAKELAEADDDPDMKELQPEDSAQLEQRFREAVIEELREGGYEVGTRSQAGTMRISFTISGLKAWGGGGAANVGAMAGGAVVGLPVIFVLSVGEVTIEGVFRDALTHRIDAVAVDRSAGSRIFNESPWSTWSDVEATFDIWAKGIREAVDEAHGK